MQRGKTLLALAALAVGTPALAKEEDRGDFNVYVQGGVGGYTGAVGEVTRAGPVWGALVNVQPTNVLGLELGYVGSRHAIDGADASLLRNGGTALLKLGLPFVERVRPWVGGGLSGNFIGVQGRAAGFRSDFMEEVPLGGGVEFNSGAVHAGVRGLYHLLVDGDFADGAAPGGDSSGAMVEAAVTLGGRF